VTELSSGRSRHLGIDLGGTLIKWAVVAHEGAGADFADGSWEVLSRGEAPTHAEEGSAEVIERLATIGQQAIEADDSITGIGIAIPGRYDPASGATGLLPNFPDDWTSVPVAPYVGRRAGVPTRLINDARAFGLAELRLGAGRGASSMVGLTLGTGLGGVVAIDGRVYQGHDGAAGEIGHQTLDEDGPLCGCGNRGCLEAYVRADRIAEACGAATADEVVTRARGGDAVALGVLAEMGRYLGIGLANAITILTPDRVVIGGGRAAALDLFDAPMRAELQHRVTMTDLDKVKIVAAELGVWAGAIGAAMHGAETSAP
jgi:glucokinase